MYFQRLDKLVHIFQLYRRKTHPTVCRIEPISRTTVDFFPSVESTKKLCCRALCDTKHLYRQNQLNARAQALLEHRTKHEKYKREHLIDFM